MSILVNPYTPKIRVVHESPGHEVSGNSLNPTVSSTCADIFRVMYSPNISVLDHQETVETDDSHQTSDISPDRDKDDPVTNSLFSFELDANGLPRCLLDQVDEVPVDLSWLDILGPTTDPVDLNDINVMPLSSPRLATALDIQVSVDRDKSDKNTPVSVTNAKTPSSSTALLDIPRNFPSPLYRPDLTAHIRLKQHNSDYRRKQVDENVDIPSRGPINAGIEKCLNNEDLITGKPGQRLCLTAEERKMLHSMGIRLPTRFPLTRAEEKALRTVRRKIRNKLSAQASRIRRQEYMVDLERRMALSTKENQRLRRHIETLENDKRDLLSHIHKLRSYISKVLNRHDRLTPLPLFVKPRTTLKSGSQAAAAGGTSLLILTFMILAWTAMVPFPSIRFFKLDALSQAVDPKSAYSFFPGRSRTLLESKPIENVALEKDIAEDDRLSYSSIPSHRTHGKQKPELPPLEEHVSSTSVNHSVEGLHTQVDTTSHDLSDRKQPSSASAILNMVATMDL
ncbi:bZIP transcription factor [Opisthorchis viverrini]|uniref:BZIP transcription factor n=1 Tax=Opisthorchis viverrini TaxID=6198 RepID=A0A1S8X7H5_OPIVI|nr:bZIP transcription factor [Opisthorchis viverrini]